MPTSSQTPMDASTRTTRTRAMSFRIYDWAGNVRFGGQRFATFEDAWDFLFEYLERRFGEAGAEAWAGEYYVEAD